MTKLNESERLELEQVARDLADPKVTRLELRERYANKERYRPGADTVNGEHNKSLNDRGDQGQK